MPKSLIETTCKKIEAGLRSCKMPKELKSLTDYAQAAVKIVEDLLAQGFDEAQISDLCGFVKQQLDIRANVRAWEKDATS